MPLISIIVPIYNVEKYLRCCLDSVLAQTFTDYECILVDDGSPDMCPAICDEYAVKDTRFKVIHKENGGLSYARNVGIQAAIGEYIVLLDSDDLFADNEALGNLCNVIEKTKVEVIFNSNLTTLTEGSYKIYDGIDNGFISGEPLLFYRHVMRNRNILLAGWLFVCLRTFLIDNNLFFKKGIVHEDEHWMPRVICTAKKIAVNHSSFYAYRKGREGSIMSVISPKRMFDRIGIIEDLLNLLKINTEKKYHYGIIYKDRCICLWLDVFSTIILIDAKYQNEKEILLGETRRLFYVLLYRISIVNLIYLFSILFIDSNFNRYIHCLQLKKHLKKIKKIFR